MNGSSAQSLIDWRTSRFCKILAVSFLAVAVIAGSLILPASAAPVIPSDTSDWIELEADPHVLWCPEVLKDPTFQEFEIGTNIVINVNNISSHGVNYAIALCAGLPIYKDCTYVLDFTVNYLSAGRYTNNFCITDSFPKIVGDLSEQYNSEGVPYLDTISMNITSYHNNVPTNYRFTFSTAEGYIDDCPTGNCYVSLLGVADSYNYSDSVVFKISELSAKCILDPSAEYYKQITVDRQNKLVDLTKESVGKMKESLEQVTIVDDMSSAVDYVSGAIGKAAALISPTATFAGDTVNIYPAFALFSNIYNNVMGSVDPALLALAATVPLLCFLAWLFSSLFKSIL